MVISETSKFHLVPGSCICRHSALWRWGRSSKMMAYLVDGSPWWTAHLGEDTCCETLPILSQHYRKVDISVSLITSTFRQWNQFKLLSDCFLCCYSYSVPEFAEEWFSKTWAFASPVSRNCWTPHALSYWGHYAWQVPFYAGSKTWFP